MFQYSTQSIGLQLYILVYCVYRLWTKRITPSARGVDCIILSLHILLTPKVLKHDMSIDVHAIIHAVQEVSHVIMFVCTCHSFASLTHNYIKNYFYLNNCDWICEKGSPTHTQSYELENTTYSLKKCGKAEMYSIVKQCWFSPTFKS